MRPSVSHKPLWLVLAAVLCAGGMWLYANRVLIPYQISDAAAHGRPRGNLSDLYPRWLGARELLLRGRDPYSQQVTSEIQRGYYGRELDPSRPNDPKDLEAFAYPIYVVFVLAPTVHMDFPTTRLLALWLLTAATILGVLLWQQVMGVKFS